MELYGITRSDKVHNAQLCVALTGNVSVVRFPHDGDTAIALTLDKPCSTTVMIGNFNDKMKGGIWVELICQRPMNLTTVEPFKIGSCNGYNGPNFYSSIDV